MMEKRSYEKFYEGFHKGTRPLGYIATKDDLTYGNPVSFVDRHVTKKSRVLDVGCGVGAISLHMANNGNSVVGIDISENAISAARKDAERFGLANATFHACNAMDLEFDEEFDVVVCFDVLEHVEDDVVILRKINRFLRIGGKLLLRVPSVNAPMHRMRLFIRGYDDFDRKAGHLRRYSKESLESLLKPSGFQILETEAVEGLLRNSVFTSHFGTAMKPLLTKRGWAVLFSELDVFACSILGCSGFNIASSKIAEPEDDERKAE